MGFTLIAKNLLMEDHLLIGMQNANGKVAFSESLPEFIFIIMSFQGYHF